MHLRNRPIEPNEVVIERFKILTLPGDACPRDSYGDPTFNSILAEPLIEQLMRERRDWEEKRKQCAADESIKLNSGIPLTLVGHQIKDMPWPSAPHPWAYRECRYCGSKFCYVDNHSRIRYCSNACIDAARAQGRRDWSQYRANRRSNRRANSNDKCAHCGAAMEAQRLTRQFCSARCRVAAYRARPRPKADLHELELLP